jgi:very-short-patch-repair endonuclease/uncharacterized protein YaeQ
MNKYWTTEEIDFLKENYLNKTYNDIATSLGRTRNSIERKLSKLGLFKKDVSDYTFWADEKISFLKDNKDIYSCKELGEKLGFTEKKIIKKLSDLGLKKLRINVPRKKKVKSLENSRSIHDIHCELCNTGLKNLKGLEIHIVKKHKNIDLREYFIKNVGEVKKCFFCGKNGKFISLMNGFRNLCESEDCLKKSFSSNSVEGIMYRDGCDLETAKKIFKDQSDKMIINRKKTNDKLAISDPLLYKKRSRNCIEFWIEKGFSEEVAKERVKEVMTEIHEKTFKKFKENPERYASKYTTKIEYYLDRGYSEEEAKKRLTERQQTFSLEKCIEKYGESNGQKIWLDRQLKWMNTMNNKSDVEKMDILKRKSSFCKRNYSIVSQRLFWLIYNRLDSKSDVFFKELNYEFIISESKTFIYDFVYKINKKIIEFNGDYWHCNPIKYNENYYHKHLKMYAKERWYNDKMRIEFTESLGYQVLTIWESEYRKNTDVTLQKCLDFLNN